MIALSSCPVQWVSRGESFEHLGYLGHGGFGQVYRVRSESGEMKALKSMPLASGSAIEINDAMREWHNHQKLDHHCNILCVQACFECFNPILRCTSICLLMDLCEGSLAAYDLSEPLGETRVMWITLQLQRGVQYIHAKNMVHRDIKPENILVAKESGGSLIIKLADLGISKLICNYDNTAALGSPTTMAPQQWHGNYGFDVDQWAIGVVAFKLLYRSLPAGRSQDDWIRMVKSAGHGNPDAITNLTSDTQHAGSGTLMEDILPGLLKFQPKERTDATITLGKLVARLVKTSMSLLPYSAVWNALRVYEHQVTHWSTSRYAASGPAVKQTSILSIMLARSIAPGVPHDRVQQQRLWVPPDVSWLASELEVLNSRWLQLHADTSLKDIVDSVQAPMMAVHLRERLLQGVAPALCLPELEVTAYAVVRAARLCVDSLVPISNLAPPRSGAVEAEEDSPTKLNIERTLQASPLADQRGDSRVESSASGLTQLLGAVAIKKRPAPDSPPASQKKIPFDWCLPPSLPQTKSRALKKVLNQGSDDVALEGMLEGILAAKGSAFPPQPTYVFGGARTKAVLEHIATAHMPGGSIQRPFAKCPTCKLLQDS